MKRFSIFAILFAMAPFFVMAQDDKPVVVETIQITVNKGAYKAFEKAVRFTCAPAFKTGEIND